MEDKITTFKELLALFYKHKACKIIPVLGDNNYVKGYYLKKNVTAHIADSSFLSQLINTATAKIFTAANGQNEGEFLEELGKIDNFPVIYSDGEYEIIDFNTFLIDFIPLNYNETDIISNSKNQNDSEINDKKNNDFSYLKNDIENFNKSKMDLFELNQEKIKPFFEEFDFNDTFDLVAYLEGVEKRVIDKYLKYYNYNVSKTADALKIPRQTLQYKIKKYDL